MARIVRIHETGGPEVLRVEDIPVRAPGPGEIRIHVEAMGINRSDVIFRYGHHPVKPQFPSLIGSEAAGTVEAIGEGVQGFSRSEEHTSELQSLMRISYAVFCLKKKKKR